MATQRSAGKSEVMVQSVAVSRDTHNTWQKYSEIHRPVRVTDFPLGIVPPRRVRIYRRQEHHVLQWWDRSEKKTLSERVDGDLVEAISRARKIDERMENRRGSGRRSRRVGHAELVERFIADLERRADAGEIDVSTVARYRTALDHYIRFVDQPRIAKQYSRADRVDRDFRLAFDAFLNQARISSNGHANTEPRPMRGQLFVVDVARGMFQWAADPDRGKLLPDDLRNPFVGRKRRTDSVAPDPVRALDISMEMAIDFIGLADQFQLSLFAPLLLYGLRPGELGWLFCERQDQRWLHVACLPELEYMTKGRRDKQFPIVDGLPDLWGYHTREKATGLMYGQRRVVGGKATPPFWGKPLASIADEFHRRCSALKSPSAAEHRRVRNRLMQEAGQLNYDHVEDEFGKLAAKLDWPSAATLKDLRHLFSTSLENAGVPEFFRRYFMGQSFGKSPIVSYTHLTVEQIERQYRKALTTELNPIVDAISTRVREIR